MESINISRKVMIPIKLPGQNKTELKYTLNTISFFAVRIWRASNVAQVKSQLDKEKVV